MSQQQKFKIERVPMPKDGRGAKGKYPFEKMQVGESFFVDNITKRSSAITAANAYGKKHSPEWKFASRLEGKGFRIFRVS